MNEINNPQPQGDPAMEILGTKGTFLSNFERCDIVYQGITYSSVENFYQAMKTTDINIRRKMTSIHPSVARAKGRNLTVRTNWNEIKFKVMDYGLREKFKPGNDLAQKLLDTGDIEIAEINYWHDSYWGKCTCAKCPTGENWLGILLMKIRKELRDNGGGEPLSEPTIPKEGTEMQPDKIITQPQQDTGGKTVDTNKPLEKGQEVFSFMNDFFHTVTNDPTPQEALGYTTALSTNKPYLMGHTIRTGPNGDYNHNMYLLPIPTGDSWEYGLLMDKLSNRGKKFNLKMIQIRDLKTWCQKDGGDITNLVDEANFAWANATHAFFLKTRKDTEWTLSDLGIRALDMKKTSKRAQEIARFSEIYKSGSMDKLTFMEYTNEWISSYYEENGLTYSSDEEVMFDGPIFIRKSVMVKMCFAMEAEAKRKMIGAINHGRHTFLGRLTFSGGLIKGLFHVVTDDDIGADVVYHSSAVKKEMVRVSNNWTFTAWPMDTSYPVSWDIQSAVNNPWLFTQDRFKLELDSLLTEFKSEIAKGEIPTWIKVNPDENQQKENIDQQSNEISEWHSNADKWQNNGHSIIDSSTFIHLAFGQLANRMRAALSNNSFWLPMYNAFFAPVITHEALQILGGQNLPESKNNLVWFDPRFGAIIPGNRFVQTAELHDTWDQDGDMARFIRIKLWSSDPTINGKMMFGGVIPEDLDIPTNADEAIDVVVIIRSPNGPGGYSINRYDADTMPFMRVNEAAVQIIDLAQATLPMGYLLANTNISNNLNKLISNTVYSNRKMTRDDGLTMIVNQMDNPGFGKYVNCMIVRASVYGPSYPLELPATGNDIIDATAQTTNVDAFKYIENGVQDMWDSMVEDIVNNGLKIDKFFEKRLPKAIAEQIPLDTMEDGIFATMMKRYAEATQKVNEEKDGTIFMRQNSTLIPLVRAAVPTLTDAQMVWLESFNTRYARKLRAWDKQKQVRRDEMSNSNSRAFKVWCAYFNSRDLATIQKDMIKEFKQARNPGYAAVCYYRWLTDPKMAYELVWHEGKEAYVKATAHVRYGLVDRVLFQSPARGQESLLDILIGGLKDLGL